MALSEQIHLETLISRLKSYWLTSLRLIMISPSLESLRPQSNGNNTGFHKEIMLYISRTQEILTYPQKYQTHSSKKIITPSYTFSLGHCTTIMITLR